MVFHIIRNGLLCLISLRCSVGLRYLSRRIRCVFLHMQRDVSYFDVRGFEDESGYYRKLYRGFAG